MDVYAETVVRPYADGQQQTFKPYKYSKWTFRGVHLTGYLTETKVLVVATSIGDSLTVKLQMPTSGHETLTTISGQLVFFKYQNGEPSVCGKILYVTNMSQSTLKIVNCHHGVNLVQEFYIETCQYIGEHQLTFSSVLYADQTFQKWKTRNISYFNVLTVCIKIYQKMSFVICLSTDTSVSEDLRLVHLSTCQNLN